MASFNDLGLREGLVMALEEEGIEHPTALQQAAIPVLRREGNLVARAASGSGKTLAWALGVLDRIEPRAEPGDADVEDGGDASASLEDDAGRTRALVLVATPERAEHTALQLVPFAAAVELSVTAAGPGWGTAPGEADVLVATPAQVMEAVRTSGVKLDAVESVVVDGASDIEALGGWEPLEMLFDNVPRTAQRVVVTGMMTPAVQDLVDRRVKRAIRYPAESKVPLETGTPEITAVVGYVPVSEREKVDVVARLLGGERSGEAAPVLVCRTDERASQVAEALAMRGFLVGDAEDEEADVAVVGSDEALGETSGGGGSVGATVISFDVPADEHSLKRRHGGPMTGFVLVEARELPHLRDIAPRAGVDARPAGITGEASPGMEELRAFRQEVRRALRDEDLGAQMLVLEPLFEDHTAAEVAAALAVLLRRKRASEPAEAAPDAASFAASSQQSARAASAPPAGSTAGRTVAAISRLYVGVGERDGVRPGDLVGAIAGETGLPGSSIGKVEIRDTFSIVEVPADAAERVIAAINGTTIKGRAVRVDYDRGGDKARRPGGGGGGRDREGGGDRPRRTFDRGGDRPDRGGDRGGGGDRPRGKFGPRDGGGGRDGGDRRPPVRRPPRPRE